MPYLTKRTSQCRNNLKTVNVSEYSNVSFRSLLKRSKKSFNVCYCLWKTVKPVRTYTRIRTNWIRREETPIVERSTKLSDSRVRILSWPDRVHWASTWESHIILMCSTCFDESSFHLQNIYMWCMPMPFFCYYIPIRVIA